MSKTAMLITFKLSEGVSVQNFSAAAEKVNSEFMPAQKGFISWEQLRDGDVWADLLMWESPDDAKNAMEASQTSSAAHEFFSFLDHENIKIHMFGVERSFRK